MNYLGHAFLSFGNAEILTGNLIADHVKGKLSLARYPRGIQNGILLHRKIDAFTDQHAAARRAALLFREDYRLYSGAIVDSLFDHFLANDPKHFPSEHALMEFSEKTYNSVQAYAAYFPEKFVAYFPYMRQQNWLYNYRTLQGMQRSLGGLHRRALHMPGPEKAYEIFIGYYYQLAQCYYDFMDDIVKYVKVQQEFD